MLLHLVNDILDLSKIQAGKMEIVPVEYETEDLVRNVGNVIRLMVQDKSLAYEVNIAKDVPKRLFGDEIRIAQVLTNLLTNAVKYTDQGKVTLTLNAVKDLKGMDAIEYIVEDTGCGIKPEDMDKLFDSYERVNLERNRRVEGTGLGMGIDRLTMLMTGNTTIQDVLFFPQMRPEKMPSKQAEEKDSEENNA